MIGGQPQSERAARQLSRETRARCLSFGGVSFELLPEHGVTLRWSGQVQRCCGPGADPRTIAELACVVRTAPGSGRPAGERVPDELTFERQPDGGLLVRGKLLQAVVRQLEPRRYAVVATMVSGPHGTEALLRGVAAAVLHSEGGVILHAAAIEVGGQAVLLVGPSGAGKSTAATLVCGATCFADDHVAIVPGASGYFAWGLPGGTASAAPRARAFVYPLGAILRVRQGRPEGAPRCTVLAGTDALFALRESVEWADASPAGEDAYLRAVTKLSSATLVGSMATVLGRDAAPGVRAFLSARVAGTQGRSA